MIVTTWERFCRSVGAKLNVDGQAVIENGRILLKGR
jgi:hypothetical protein